MAGMTRLKRLLAVAALLFPLAVSTPADAATWHYVRQYHGASGSLGNKIYIHDSNLYTYYQSWYAQVSLTCRPGGFLDLTYFSETYSRDWAHWYWKNNTSSTNSYAITKISDLGQTITMHEYSNGCTWVVENWEEVWN
jgi:hypothetical protein